MRLSLFRALRFFALSFLFITFNAKAELSDISKIYQETPSLDGFKVCWGGSCAQMVQVAISSAEWEQVRAVFLSGAERDASSGSIERKRISEAVGLIETIVGEKTGTSADRAGTFNNSKYPNQLDCNDEAINTTTYIRLMQKDGLITLHENEDIRTRNFFFNGWPHTTAVIHEIATGKRFAVDSWFYDNGIPATIVPFKLWKSGYIPSDSPIYKP